MNQPIKLTHAQFKTKLDNPVEVLVYPQHIFAVFYMPEMDATAVQSIAGAFQPVKETKEDVCKMITDALNKTEISTQPIKEVTK